MPLSAALPLQRQHLDLGADYLLRSVAALAALFGGDLSRGLVYLAALQASAPPAPVSPDRSIAPPVEGDQRRAVSLSSIARSLAMSVETTRRHVMRLEQAGLVDRTPSGGVMIRLSTLPCEAVQAALAANSANLARLGEGLERLRARAPSARAAR